LRRLAGPDPAIVAGAFLWSSQSFSNLWFFCVIWHKRRPFNRVVHLRVFVDHTLITFRF
jgi:hypothetical protein